MRHLFFKLVTSRGVQVGGPRDHLCVFGTPFLPSALQTLSKDLHLVQVGGLGATHTYFAEEQGGGGLLAGARVPSPLRVNRLEYAHAHARANSKRQQRWKAGAGAGSA